MRAGDAIRNAHAKDMMRVLTTSSARELAAKHASGASIHVNVAANNEPRNEHSVRRKSLADTKQKPGTVLKNSARSQISDQIFSSNSGTAWKRSATRP